MIAAAETISNVLPCGKVGSVGGLGAGTDLARYTLDTARFPNAVCNDGTPRRLLLRTGDTRRG